MTVNSYWFVQDKIWVNKYIDETTREELSASIDHTLANLDRVNNIMYIVGDWRKSDRYPMDYGLISKVVKGFGHPKLGAMFFIGFNPILGFWLSLLPRIPGFRVHKVNSLEEVLKVVETLEVRATE
jgi:hypothetical protein